MRAFEYRAATSAGEVITGTAWAASELDLDARLGARGLLLTRARALSDASGKRRGRVHRIRGDELIRLTNQLATVVSAGVPIVEGLRGIGERLSPNGGRPLVAEMVSALEAGESLSGVMSAYPASFPEVYRASVRAGEESGSLEVVLQRLAKHLEWARGIRATAAQALVYPAILCAAIAGLIAILLFFVLPRILGMFPGGVADLPAQTRFVLALSDLLRAHWFAAAVASAGVAVAVAWTLRRPAGRRAFHALLLRVPRLGGVVAQIATSRFASTAAVLQASGCDVFTMLATASATCGNDAMAASFGRATDRVQRGVLISEALASEPLVDPLLVQMAAVGERSGSLDRCFAKLVEHYDDEVPRAVKRFLSLLEPALLVGAGVVVAFLLLSALLPIFDLYERIR